MLKSIRNYLTDLKKDITYFLDIDKSDLDDIEPMRREKEINIAPASYIAPGGPRIKYKRR
jgi:hypothetical protein